MPPDSNLVQVGVLLWPLEKSVKLRSDVLELNDKRRAPVGHQFKFMLNSTIYKQVQPFKQEPLLQSLFSESGQAGDLFGNKQCGAPAIRQVKNY